jgi:SepF-like predicted cell division protein (DUF552 family)
MKVKDLIKSLKEVDPESIIFADVNPPEENKTKMKIISENLKEIVYNKHEKIVSFSFEKSEIMEYE